MEKKVHFRVDRNNNDITLRDVMEKMLEIQTANPDREVFWDGDENAICSRKKVTS